MDDFQLFIVGVVTLGIVSWILEKTFKRNWRHKELYVGRYKELWYVGLCVDGPLKGARHACRGKRFFAEKKGSLPDTYKHITFAEYKESVSEDAVYLWGIWVSDNDTDIVMMLDESLEKNLIGWNYAED